MLPLLIDSLNLSENFKAQASAQDFLTLADILNWSPSVLFMYEGFPHHHLPGAKKFSYQKGIDASTQSRKGLMLYLIPLYYIHS